MIILRGLITTNGGDFLEEWAHGKAHQRSLVHAVRDISFSVRQKANIKIINVEVIRHDGSDTIRRSQGSSTKALNEQIRLEEKIRAAKGQKQEKATLRATKNNSPVVSNPY